MNQGLWSLSTIDLRALALDKHRTVDDTPYGGGGGMVLRPDVLAAAIDSLHKKQKDARSSEGDGLSNEDKSLSSPPPPLIYLSPRGSLFNQHKARKFAKAPGISLICGRFEGIDERILSEYEIEELSIGNYVMSCGDIAAFVVLDSCIRLLPGVLGNHNSIDEESFGAGEYEHLLEYPHYTKPAEWRGHKVPDVLRSGDHQMIKKWRLHQAKEKTMSTRPDLWGKYQV